MVRGMGRGSSTMNIKTIRKLLYMNNKWFRRLAKLSLAMIIVMCVKDFCFKNWEFLEIRDEKVPIKILIPPYVAKDKNCDAFDEWQNRVIPSEYKKECPWR
jgi:hypothetical protein